MGRANSFQHWRPALGCLAAALALALILGTPGGRSAASGFLSHFRNDQFAAAALDTGEIADIETTLAELANLGRLDGFDEPPEPRPVKSVAEASRFVGFPVLEPDPATLPEVVDGSPTAIRVLPAHQVRFTFDLERARAHYQSTGRDGVNLPERFDGVALVVEVPPAVLLQYRAGEDRSGAPSGVGLVIGQAGTLAVSAEGATLDELQEFLLELPGLSPATERQLENIDEWQTTLPLPLPVAEINWERATIAGQPGLLLDDNTGLGSAAIWQRDGRIFGVAGTMKAGELLDVAESLR